MTTLSLERRLRKIESGPAGGGPPPIYLVFAEDGMTNEDAWRAMHGERPMPTEGRLVVVHWIEPTPPTLTPEAA